MRWMCLRSAFLKFKTKALGNKDKNILLDIVSTTFIGTKIVRFVKKYVNIQNLQEMNTENG